VINGAAAERRHVADCGLRPANDSLTELTNVKAIVTSSLHFIGLN
jgi:hypothetical protein